MQDILINNAATYSHTRQLTTDNHELQFQVNVYAYYAVITQLLDHLLKGEEKRIVNVASTFAGHLDLTDLEFTKRQYDNVTAYMQSKACDRLLSAHINTLYGEKGIICNACNPGTKKQSNIYCLVTTMCVIVLILFSALFLLFLGTVTSNLLGSCGMSEGPDSATVGAQTPLYLAFSTDINKGGKFYVYCKETEDEYATDTKSQEKLWQYLQAF